MDGLGYGLAECHARRGGDREVRGMVMRIFGDSISGNCLKVKWVSDYLGIPYAWE